jgi:RNA polymerase sigma factor (sigma-70 family)
VWEPLDVGALYVQYRTLLLYIAGRKFSVPERDSEELVQEALLSLLRSGERIERPRAWLVAAMCNASRGYWRERGRFEAVEGASVGAAAVTIDAVGVERLEREILVRRVLERMRPRDCEVLRLHYFERLTAPELATRLDTTAGYAEKLIVKALKRAREVYGWLSTPRAHAKSQVTSRLPVPLLVPRSASERESPAIGVAKPLTRLEHG